MIWYNETHEWDLDEQKKLLKQYKDTGKQTYKDKLIMSYSSYLKHVAASYCAAHKGTNYEDIIQAAALWLSNGIETFDYDKSDELLKIAGFYIRAEMNNYRSINNAMWLKPAVIERMGIYYRAVEQLKEKDKKITVKNIRDITGRQEKTVVGIENALWCASLDEPFWQDWFNLYEVIAGNNIDNINKKYIIEEMSTYLSKELNDIIVMYYINDETYQSIGDELGCSYEAVRNKINKGLNILRRVFIVD